MIERAIYDHLIDPSSGDASNDNRQTARYRLRNLAGNAIYVGRIPDKDVPYALLLRRVDGGHVYNLDGEEQTAQPIVEFTLYGRREDSAIEVLNGIEYVRKIFSGYRGDLGNSSEHFVYGCTIERDLMPLSLAPPDGLNKWLHRYSMDLRFTIDQEAI